MVLTFDDVRPGQFRYLPDGRVDPYCAVGILETFHHRYPDWPRRATFSVLPESQYNGVPFDQDGLETRKLRFLVRRGYELADHTISHRSLADLDVPTLHWEMAGAAVSCWRRAGRLLPPPNVVSTARTFPVSRLLRVRSNTGSTHPARFMSATAGRTL